MSEQTGQSRRRRYLIDAQSQLSFAVQVVGVVLMVGFLDAAAVFILSDPSVQGTRALEDTRLLLLAVHSACVLFGAAFLFWIVVKLTHRYAGPAYVMQRALEGMRDGEYGHRLSLRTTDFHTGLADALEGLRSEIAARDVTNARVLHRLERGLDDQDDAAVRASLRALGTALPTPAQRRHDDTKRRSA